MELNELKAFIAVTEAGSFSEAARLIHLSQPAVSKRIANLESSLNQPLFDRVSHRVSLTEAGLRLLPHARAILDAMQNGMHELDQLQQTPSGTLRIATSYHVGLHYLPGIFKSYYNDFPHVELDLHFMDSEDALSAVEHGEIELAIITLPQRLPEQLKSLQLWDDPMQIVCARDHALVFSSDMRDLSQHPAILPDSHTITRQLVESVLQEQEISINVRLSSNHLESIRMMVEIGLGWSVLPETLGSENLQSIFTGRISFIRKLGVVTHKQRTLTKAAELLLARIQ